MASDYPAFLRPVEFTGTAAHPNDVTLTIGAGHHDLTIDSGVYCNVYSLAQNIVKQAVTAGHTISFAVGADMKLTLTCTGMTLKWNNTTLSNYLGFASSDITDTGPATYVPRYMWLPTYVRSDQNLWEIDYDRAFPCNEALTGNVNGIATQSTSGLSTVSMVFPHEATTNTHLAKCTTSALGYRCLEYFMAQSKSSWPQVSTYPPTNGFQYWEDRTDIATLVAANGMTGASTGNTGGHSGSIVPSLGYDWVYCHFDSKSCLNMGASLQRGTTRANVPLKIHTATVVGTYATSVVP